MIQTGTIVNIEVETLGAELSAAVSLGASVLPLRSTVDFTDLGGTLMIGTEVHTFSADSVDDEALTVTIDDTLAAGYSADEFVYVAPAPIVRYWAHVQIDQESDEVILAEAPRALVLMLETGLRDVDDQETAAVIEERDGTWTLIDVLGLEPAIVGSSIDVPGIGETGFHVDSAGNASFGGTTPTDGDQSFWSIGGPSNNWEEIVGHLPDVDLPASILVLGAGVGGTRVQQLILTGPRDTDLPESKVVIESHAPGGVASAIGLFAETIAVEATDVGGDAVFNVQGSLEQNGIRVPTIAAVETQAGRANNTTTETSLLSSAYTIPASEPGGRIWKVKLHGLISNRAVADTLTIRFKYGTTTLRTVSLTMPASAQTARVFDLEAMLRYRVAGGSGQAVASLIMIESTTGAGANVPVWRSASSDAADIAVDTTAARVLDVTAQWSVADANNDARTINGYVEIIDD